MKVAILIGAGFLCAARFPAQDQLRDKLDDIYARGGYSRDLPGETAVEVEKKKDSGRSYDSPIRDSGDSSWHMPEWLRSVVSVIVTALPWIGVAILVWLLALMVIWSRRGEALPERRATERVEPFAPAGPVADEPVPDHVLLAREGRFEEAIHALLLLAIRRIRAATSDTIDPSLTSREIARGAKVAQDVRAPLGRLVRAVEITLFGGRPAAESDYEACAADLRLIEARP